MLYIFFKLYYPSPYLQTLQVQVIKQRSFVLAQVLKKLNLDIIILLSNVDTGTVSYNS